MSYRRLIVFLGLCTMLASGGGSAWATIDNLKSFKEAYPGKGPKAYSCKVCHLGAIGKQGDLNAYGAALQALQLRSDVPAPVKTKKLAVEDYSLIEADDADGDGASNGGEFTAGTDPADPASVPAGTAAPQPEPPTAGEAPTSPNQVPEPASQGVRERMQASLDALAGPSAWAQERPDAQAAQEPAGETAPKGSDTDTPSAQAAYVGTDTCMACHGEIAGHHQRSAHAKIGAEGPGGLDISCESCHGAGSLHAEAGGGKGVGGLTNPSKNPSPCFACHTDKKMEFALQYHHPVPEGRMSCADCHAPHGETPTPRAARAQNEQCLQCHEQIKGPWVFEHLALRDGCLSCHQPHGSITTRLLAERDFNLCLKCHFSGLQYQRLGHYAHRRAYNPSGMEGANCTGCHRAVHGSNFSKELRTQ